MTLESKLLRKRLWTTGDFAEWMGVSPKVARALLKRLDAEVGGMLLRTDGEKNPKFRLCPAVLFRAKPELREKLHNLTDRVERCEDAQEATSTKVAIIAAQVAQNTRDIAKMRTRSKAA